MSRARMLSLDRPPYIERKKKIENEPLPKNIGSLLESMARAHGDKLALHFFESDSAPLTYGDVLLQVNRLANGLKSKGITKGSHVAVMLPNIVQFPITWLALARLGAVMVPINIAYTGRELKYVVDDSRAQCLIIHDDCLAAWRDIGKGQSALLGASKIFVVDSSDSGYASWNSLLEGQDAAFEPESQVEQDDLMNIQYTSGTTGFPKGCMLTHRYWLIAGKQNAFRDGLAYRRVLASTPFFYMDPQWQFIMSMYSGACLFVAKRQSASRFMSWIRDYRINFALMPDVVLKQPVSDHDRDHELMRVNVYGLSKDNHMLLEERFDVCAREAFGMTEIGTGLFMPLEAADMVGSGSCGVPVPFREARVADPEGNTVPDGEIGELLVRGPGIMKGYFNRPEATAASFHGDWFRTGDLFRRDHNGYFYIIGRIKEMIRRAGENISVHELESVLLAYPEVCEAAVVGVKDDTRGEEVKAYVVPQQGVRPDMMLDPLIIYCKDNLASFKVPRYFEFRDALPKTASGKIAKPALLSEKVDLRAGSYDRVVGSWQ
ncbi:class I adenylate-forming enzyme family protein [Pollutimonas thiosulfatoxidans]|uniref:AMP-binding protein n=1 Tax=Pollutimonas thiosulfatoxidans TaxID=2028345 RepID=A0A410GEB0_9BURK|nr:class I adenylate-forming enzyme family protein [Pollutimonas thiosulfatoxidans]QAA94632.1 AMP-binding protein [Pollutimonas thiosulfatoxidans]